MKDIMELMQEKITELDAIWEELQHEADITKRQELFRRNREATAIIEEAILLVRCAQKTNTQTKN